MWQPNQQAIGPGQGSHQGTVLRNHGMSHKAVWTLDKGRPQIVRALVIGRQVTAQARRAGLGLDIEPTGKPPEQWHEEKKRTYIRGDGVPGHAQYLHVAQPPVHHRPAWAKCNAPKRQIQPFGGKCALDEVMFSDGSASGRDKYISLPLARPANRHGNLLNSITRDPEIEHVRAFVARESC